MVSSPSGVGRGEETQGGSLQLADAGGEWRKRPLPSLPSVSLTMGPLIMLCLSSPFTPPFFYSSSSGPPSLLNSPPTALVHLLLCSHPLSLPPVVHFFQLASSPPQQRYPAACPASPLSGPAGPGPAPGPDPGAIPPFSGTRERSQAHPNRVAGRWGRGRPGTQFPLAPRPDPASRAPPPQPGPSLPMSWAVVMALAALLLLLLLTRRRTR